ncbi:hypothetical protein [Hydrogenimonas sp.]
MSGGMPVSSQFGAVYAAGWLINKIQNRKRKEWFHELSAYSHKEHIEYLLKMWKALRKELPVLLKGSGVDPQELEKNRPWLESLWWYTERYELPEYPDPEDEKYFDIVVALLAEMGRWIYDLGQLLGKKAADAVWHWIKHEHGDYIAELLWDGAHTKYYEDTNTNYVDYFPHHQAWLTARAYELGMQKEWEEKIRKAKTLPQLYDIFRSMTLAYYRKRLSEAPVPREEWEPMVKRLEDLCKKSFVEHEGAKLRKMLSEALERKFAEHLPNA